MLTVAPEGTRKRGDAIGGRGSIISPWAPGVPLLCGLMDYGTKTGGLGPAIMADRGLGADMEQIIANSTAA